MMLTCPVCGWEKFDPDLMIEHLVREHVHRDEATRAWKCFCGHDLLYDRDGAMARASGPPGAVGRLFAETMAMHVYQTLFKDTLAGSDSTWDALALMGQHYTDFLMGAQD